MKRLRDWSPDETADVTKARVAMAFHESKARASLNVLQVLGEVGPPPWERGKLAQAVQRCGGSPHAAVTCVRCGAPIYVHPPEFREEADGSLSIRVDHLMDLQADTQRFLRTWNAHESQRTCPACGLLHPAVRWCDIKPDDGV